MDTLLDPYEIANKPTAAAEISVDVEWDEDAAREQPRPRGVTALAWSRARGWTVED